MNVFGWWKWWVGCVRICSGIDRRCKLQFIGEIEYCTKLQYYHTYDISMTDSRRTASGWIFSASRRRFGL